MCLISVCVHKNASPSIECESVSCSSFNIFVFFTHVKQIQMHLLQHSYVIARPVMVDSRHFSFSIISLVLSTVYKIQPYQLVAFTTIVFHILTVSVVHSLTQRHAKQKCIASLVIGIAFSRCDGYVLSMAQKVHRSVYTAHQRIHHSESDSWVSPKENHDWMTNRSIECTETRIRKMNKTQKRIQKYTQVHVYVVSYATRPTSCTICNAHTHTHTDASTNT